LRPYVSAYHFVTVGPTPDKPIEDLFYPGWANLRFTLAGAGWTARIGDTLYAPVPAAAMFGATSRAAVVSVEAGALAGAGLTPLGWARLFGEDASAFADRISSLDRLIGDEAEHLLAELRAADDDAGQAAVLDSWFTRRLAQRPEPDELVLTVHRIFMDPELEQVEEAAARLAISPRHMTRIAQRLFGLTPKLLLRRQRFMRTLMELRKPAPRPWVERLDARYYDQSHFVRDCHRFLGMSPSRFFALPRPILEASTSARTRLLGEGAQSLHPPARGQAAGDPEG
jgi:AraC-like DNA-binding protein